LAFLPRIFRPSAKVVATFHCIDRNHQKWGFIARMALRLGEWAACHFAHETIVVSNTLAHYCREVYGCNAEYIPNGITPPTARGGKTSVLSKLGLAHDRYVVMVSRLVRHKGVHTLIEAWRKMKMSTDDEQVKPLKLVIVGDGAFTDEYVAEIRKMAKGLNDIVFAGFRTGVELDALLRHSAFAVHPSMSEGLPIAVLEEMSYAKAVLASDIPEQLEIIEERGYTFKAGNVKDLMLQMYYVATHPRERAARALKAQKFVTQHYRWDDIVKTTADLYRAVVRPVTVKASKASTIQPARRAAS
jgi:glycosyltransferase involved in cell wall biosynthesis